MSKEAMLDIETFGTKRNSLILSIGVVIFDPYKLGEEHVHEKHYIPIDPLDSEKYGVEVNLKTVFWWMVRSEDARKYILTLVKEGLPLLQALDKLDSIIGDIPVWGNGAIFDNVLIKDTYELVGREVSWSYRNDRCYRTLAAITPNIPLERVGVYHNPVDDALTQALHLQKIYNHYGIKE